MLLKKFKVAFTLTGIFLLLSSTVFSQLSGNYTINSAAVTGGTNFQNFNDLASVLASNGVIGNVTVDVVAGSGPYTEQVTFTTIAGSGPGAMVTINGNGATITAATTTSDRHIFRLTDVSYFTLNNLNVIPTTATNILAVHIYNTGSNITINNVSVTMTGATTSASVGIAASGSQTGNLTAGNFSGITFSNNTVTGGGYSVSFYGTNNSGLLINNNILSNYSSNSIYTRGTNGAIIRNNTISKSIGTGGTLSFNAIQLAQSDNNNASVFNNLITHDATAVGTFKAIYVFGGTGHKVYNNVIRDIHAETGGAVTGITVRGGAPEVSYNTIDFAYSPAATTAVNLVAFAEELSNSGTILKNNIFSITQPTTGSLAGIALSSSSTITTAITSNNNIFWLPTGNVASRGVTLYTTLNNWQLPSTQDAQSLSTNPFFIANTAIPTSAIVNNTGTPVVGITTDITGASRTGTPDPGAYEFATAANDAAITRFVSPLAPFCASSLNVQFELTNSGSALLTTATIDWTVNGIAQTAVNWTGSLSSGASAIVSLGNIPINSTTTYQLVATVSNPNGQSDAHAGNNTVTYNGYRSGMIGTYTINAVSPASALNYQSFQSLANDLSTYGVCGAITISVLNGPYTAQVIFDSIPGASADNSVLLNGNNQLLTFNPTVAADDYILQLSNVDYFTVSQLNVKSMHASNGRPVFITNGSSHITINRCTVEASKTVSGSSAFGIIASGVNYLLDGSFANNLVITGNTIIGGYVGIQITGEDPGLVDFVTITDNIVEDQYLYAIQATGVKDANISRNNISRPTRTSSGSFYGISLSFRSNGFIIDKNKIHNLQNNGMSLGHLAGGISISGTSIAPSAGTISNNLIYNFTNTSTQYGINDASWGAGSSVSIYHNTIALNYSAMTGSATTSVINLGATSTLTGAHDIRNNIFYLSRGGTGTKRIIDVASAATTFSSNFNVFWFETSTGTIQYGRVASNTYTSFGAWQGVGKDVNSVSLNPQITDTINHNYRPFNAAIRGSALITSLLPGVITDINNVARSSTPDPGAYEFSGTLPVRLGYFTGKNNNGINQLQWKTATEQNNKGFELQHSRDGVQFTTIAFINSKAPDGNSSLALDYSFDDLTPMPGDNYYRLKQVDRNDRFEYSGIVRIRNEKGRIIMLGPIHPNPVKASLKTIITAGVAAEINVLVTDLAGRILLQKAVRLTAGNNTLELPVSQLAAGTYLLKTSSSSLAESAVQKFIKQ